MYNRVKKYVRDMHMLEEKDHIIAGVSGGADSVCLLDILVRLSEVYRLSVTVVHVNHGLRGKEAFADEAFTEALCRKYQIPFLAYHIDVEAVRKERRISEEEAGRDARREIFRAVMQAEGGTKIALAHHKNDNAETLLLNVARGTGLKGLGGIRPVNGPYIRPLLCVQRCEIEAYLEEKQLSYCMDATNAGDNYTRNRIRNHIIPSMECEINEKAAGHMADLAGHMAELYEYVEGQTRQYYEACAVWTEEAVLLRKEVFEQVPRAIRPYVLRMAVVAISKREKDMEQVHIRELAGLMENQAGKRISLPYGIEAHRCYEGIKIGKFRNAGHGEDQTGEGSIYKVSKKVFSRREMPQCFEETPYTKWFDYDIIKNTVEIRARKTGDYIVIDKCGNTQKIKKFMMNAKIPREDRERVMLVADGSDIMWIIGYRQSYKYQVTEKTERILEIKVEVNTNGGENDGRDD